MWYRQLAIAVFLAALAARGDARADRPGALALPEGSGRADLDGDGATDCWRLDYDGGSGCGWWTMSVQAPCMQRRSAFALEAAWESRPAARRAGASAGRPARRQAGGRRRGRTRGAVPPGLLRAKPPPAGTGCRTAELAVYVTDYAIAVEEPRGRRWSWAFVATDQVRLRTPSIVRAATDGSLVAAEIRGGETSEPHRLVVLDPRSGRWLWRDIAARWTFDADGLRIGDQRVLRAELAKLVALSAPPGSP